MQFCRALAERRGAGEKPALEGGEKWRRAFFLCRRCRKGRKGFRSADSCRDPFVVTPQLVDRVLPCGTLVLDGSLQDGQCARFEARPVVFERADERGDSREAPAREEAPDFELRIEPGLDPSE